MNDLFSDDTCPGCGLELPLWRDYPFHLPNGVHHYQETQLEEPWPYLNSPYIDGFLVACEWTRRNLRNRYDRRHGVPT